MRLSLRRGAWGVSTPQASAGNRGKWGTQSFCCRCNCSLDLPQASPLLGMTILLQGHGPKSGQTNRCLWSDRIVIPTGAYPDFLPRSTHRRPRVRLPASRDRMKFANAAKLDRKSGGAQWRDLRFLFRFSRRLSSPVIAKNPPPRTEVRGWHSWARIEHGSSSSLLQNIAPRVRC